MPSSFSLLRSRLVHSLCAGVSLAFLTAASASASPIVFAGEDVGATPGSARPNSLAAAASFDVAAAALGNVGVITFESQPVGSFSSLKSGDVTITGTNYVGNSQVVENSPDDPSDPSLSGFNVTPGGANYVEMDGGTLLFTFASPTQFFGAVLTGLQSGFYQSTLTFSDGTQESIGIPETGTGIEGATDFVGFTDAGKSISSVTITAGQPGYGDFIGVDDVRYQTPSVSTTPEPGSFVLLLTGLSGIGAGYRRFRSER